MTNLTLTAAELGYLKKAFATIFMGTLLSCALVQWHYGVTFKIALPRSFSAAMLGTSLLFYAFYRWFWRWGKLAKWMGRPVLHGVWLGYIASNFHQVPSQTPLRKRIVFVVRQTYLTLSVQTFTDTQIGESTMEALIRNTRLESVRLAYVFELKNEYPGATRLTNGAGDLQLYGTSLLQGTYWTSSPSRGALKVQRVATSCEDIARFEDAVAKWPSNESWEA